MDNKQQRRTGTLEHQHAAPPPGATDGEADLKESARKYKAHQKAITRGLRKFYDDVAAEPVPDEFMALLRQMDEGSHE